jgi:ubiquinone/menaquinone biosynthesis C-methylase UbiE
MNETTPLLFSGSIPANYDEGLGPMFFEPYAKEVRNYIDVKQVSTVLEIASGTGRVTRHLRATLSKEAKLIASDISPDMLQVAQKKLREQNIEWKIVDAQDLPLADASVELVVCYFGFMMVPDRAKAYAEAYRVLKSGGMLLMATWDKLEHNEASHVFRKTLKQYMGDSLPESYKLPFSMYDPEPILQMLSQAGFTNAAADRVVKICESPNARVAANSLVNGGSLYNEISKRNPAWIDEIISVVEKELSEKYGASPMRAPMSALIVRAWKQ